MVLLELFGGLRKNLRVRQGADVDSAVFKIHYSVTSSILIACSLIVTSTTIAGDPINCIYGNDPRLKDKVINSYCWVHTTFTLPQYYNKDNLLGTAHVHPGIGAELRNHEKVYHAYYQWVPFVLFLQALLFYAPHWLWKTWEGHKISNMIEGLSNPVMTLKEKREKSEVIADYMLFSLNTHNLYAIKFIFCEALNAFNAVFMMYLLNKFFSGMFSNLGTDCLSYIQQEQNLRTDPLIMVFPRITKCTFLLYGPSGTIENIDCMCVLTINALNEKIFVFIWFWLVFLCLISSLALVYRIAALFIPSFRIGLLERKTRFKSDLRHHLKNRMHFGDFFVLNLISKNVSSDSFSMLMKMFYDKLDVAFRRSSQQTPTSPEEFLLMERG